MKVLLVEPNADPRTIEIDDSLASMQSLVGGLIEAVYPFSGPRRPDLQRRGKIGRSAAEPPLKTPRNRRDL